MKIYVLDDNGHVVFEYIYSEGQYNKPPSDLKKIEVISVVKTCLMYLARHLDD